MNNFKDSSELSKPFDKKGEPKRATTILAILLSHKTLTRNEILTKLGEEHAGKTRGYLAHTFKELNRYEILSYDASRKTWTQGKKFQEYMGYVFMRLAMLNNKVLEGFQYLISSKTNEQAIDFIKQPDEDVFNPYLD